MRIVLEWFPEEGKFYVVANGCKVMGPLTRSDARSPRTNRALFDLLQTSTAAAEVQSEIGCPSAPSSNVPPVLDVGRKNRVAARFSRAAVDANQPRRSGVQHEILGVLDGLRWRYAWRLWVFVAAHLAAALWIAWTRP